MIAVLALGWRYDIPSLNALLVGFAAIALLFTGRYPRDIFSLVVGINRWLFRVIAYAALMRDEYPPFRLDAGPDEPGMGPKTLRVGPFGPAPATPAGPIL